MLLDTPRGVALSSIKNRAIQQPFSHVNLKSYLVTRQKLIDRALDRYLPKANTKPATLHRAMRYSLFAGGKRLRPILCLAAAEACRRQDRRCASARLRHRMHPHLLARAR